MPQVIDARAGLVPVILNPGNAHTLKMTWVPAAPEGDLTAVLGATPLTVTRDEDDENIVYVAFTAAATTALAQQAHWTLYENAQKILTGPVSPSNQGTARSSTEVTVTTSTWNLTVTAAPGAGPPGEDGADGQDGADGVDGVAAADAPLTYDVPTRTIGIDQTALELDAAVLVSGTIDDARIPATITRDSELTAAVTAAVNGVLDGAPAALDTLNELAAAVNDDASFAATVTTALAAKAAVDGSNITAATWRTVLSVLSSAQVTAITDALDARLDAIEGLGSLATDAEVSAAIAALSGTYAAISGERRDKVMRVLSSPSAAAGIKRVSSTEYRLFQRLIGQAYWRINLAQLSGSPGSTTLHQLHTAFIDMPWISVDHTDGSVVRTGAGWSGPTAQALSYGGTYHQNNTGTGQDVTWTTPAGTTRVGMRAPHVVNAGVHKVLIDGDATKANLLPTAQELVTRGTLAASALVAGGGTLNPTDRVFDQYSEAYGITNATDWDRHVAFADGLASGVHTVQVVVTGYQNTNATGFRLYDSGWTYGKLDTTIDTASIEMLPLLRVIANDDSAWEYAHEFDPDAGGTTTFIGSVHGYDQQSSIAFVLDGAALTLADGEQVFGVELEIIRVSALRHPDVGAGATTVADKVTNYTLDRFGLAVTHTTVWHVAGTLTRNYPAMFPLDGRQFTQASLAAATVDYDLTANLGAYNGALASDLVYAWSDRIGACLHLPDLKGTVNDFTNGGSIKAAIEDRTPGVNKNTGNLSKIYMTRSHTTGATEAVAAGARHLSRAVYRVALLPNADEVLSR